MAHTEMAADDEIALVAARIGAVAHPVRLAIVCLLASQGELCVSEVMAAVGTTQSNASQHLQCLFDRNLLRCRKDKNRVFYSILDERLAAILAMVRAAYCDPAPSRSRRRMR